MTVEGRVEAIMEVSPLRLAVESGGFSHTIQLSRETTISEGGREVTTERLRTGQRLEVQCRKAPVAGATWLIAEHIEIME